MTSAVSVSPYDVCNHIVNTLTAKATLRQKTSTVRLWTHTHTLCNTHGKKFNQTNIQMFIRLNIALFCFSKDPTLLSYDCLAEFFTGTHMAAPDLQTNCLPTSYWLASP